MEPEREEIQELSGEAEFQQLSMEPPPIFSWGRMIQQAVVAFMILLAFIGISRMPESGPLGHVRQYLHQALHADANSTFGVIARQPGIAQVTQWAAKTWKEMQDSVPTSVETPRWVPPVPGGIVAGFDRTLAVMGQAAGIDLQAQAGAPVRASGSGVVDKVSRDAGGFWRIGVDHGNGWSTVYGHCGEVKVKVGEAVEVGQELGTAGENTPSGALVHWEIWHGAQPVDPTNFVSGGLGA